MNVLLAERALPSGPTLQLVQGDISAEKTEAIVNAANEHLQHGAGVAGAISRRGGPDIQRQSDEWVRAHGLVSHAAPAWTSGGNLAARYVIHAVGPMWRGGHSGEDVQLAAAVNGSLQTADELKVRSIALPALSTGTFGFPPLQAAQAILNAIQEYFASTASQVELVRVVLYDRETVAAFEKVWHDYFSA